MMQISETDKNLNLSTSIEIYISESGNDDNDGSIQYPYKTLERAIAETGKYKASTIHIKEGRYYIADTIVLNENNSNVCIKAQGNVIFDGGINIDKDSVQDYKDDIKVIDLKSYNIKLGEYNNRGFRRGYVCSPNELFVDGNPYKIARYPKEGIVKFEEKNIVDGGSVPRKEDYEKKDAILKFDDELIKRWSSAKDAYIGGIPKESFADDCIKIKKIDRDKGTITTDGPHLYGFEANGFSGWYIVNLLEELSEKGEYFIDRFEGKLYFIADGNFENIQLSVLDKVMIAIENAENVVIDGIVFENSRNSGIYIEGGKGNIIKNCVFRNLGILAVQIGKGAENQPYGLHNCHGKRAEFVAMPNLISREMGSRQEYIYEFAACDFNGGENHLIESCKIYNMGAGGIVLSGGNRKKLIPANNKVNNCEIFQVNRLEHTYRAAIDISGVGNSITHCEIYDLPSIAILLHGNDHIVEYNKIHHVCHTYSDTGAIYMGRDMSEVGNIFRYNFIYSIHNAIKTALGVCAIYMDDWSIYNMVYGNYFYDIVSDGKFFFSTIYHTCGGCTSIGNNIIIDCFPGLNPNIKSNANLHMHTDELSKIRVNTNNENDIRGVDITSEIYREKYPYLYETYVNDYNPGNRVWHNRVFVNQYEQFVDARNMDFTLKDDCEFLNSNMEDYKITDAVFGLNNENIDVKKIDFKKIGLIRR